MIVFSLRFNFSLYSFAVVGNKSFDWYFFFFDLFLLYFFEKISWNEISFFRYRILKGVNKSSDQERDLSLNHEWETWVWFYKLLNINKFNCEILYIYIYVKMFISKLCKIQLWKVDCKYQNGENSLYVLSLVNELYSVFTSLYLTQT